MTTKLELTQLLAARNSDLEAARLRISVLEGELALRPRTTAKAAKVVKPYTAWTRPAWMEEARAQAMATGRVVLA